MAFRRRCSRLWSHCRSPHQSALKPGARLPHPPSLTMNSAPAGLVASLRGFATTSVGLLRARLELFKLELLDESGRLLGLLLWGFAAVLLLVVGLAFAAVFLTVLLWDGYRLLALGLFALLFLVAAGVAVASVLRLARQGSQLFAASLAELRRDEAGMKSTTAGVEVGAGDAER
jgi:uncharacterized membrane protein YqjE